MKKIFSLILFLTLLTSALFAETEEKLVSPKATSSSDRLVEVETRRVGSKLDDMERRLRDLERYQRSQDDRMRNLERSVNDLKRLRT